MEHGNHLVGSLVKIVGNTTIKHCLRIGSEGIIKEYYKSDTYGIYYYIDGISNNGIHLPQNVSVNDIMFIDNVMVKFVPKFKLDDSLFEVVRWIKYMVRYMI